MNQMTKKIAKLIFAIFILSFFTLIAINPAHAASSNVIKTQERNSARQEINRSYVQGIRTINQAFSEAIQTINSQFRIAMLSVTKSQRGELLLARNRAIREVVQEKIDGMNQLRAAYVTALREVNGR